MFRENRDFNHLSCYHRTSVTSRQIQHTKTKHRKYFNNKIPKRKMKQSNTFASHRFFFFSGLCTAEYVSGLLFCSYINSCFSTCCECIHFKELYIVNLNIYVRRCISGSTHDYFVLYCVYLALAALSLCV